MPAVGLGSFTLGMTIRNAIQKLQELQSSVGNFDLKYCKEVWLRVVYVACSCLFLCTHILLRLRLVVDRIRW